MSCRQMQGSGGVHGVLIIDKPSGPTSHDVVRRLRQRLGTRHVGHAGTLDPAATGVLVVLVGDATKLGPYLTGQDKGYLASVELGRATDTLDAEGAVVAEAPVAGALEVELRRAAAGVEPGALLASALERERRRVVQTPPAHSAIQVGGVRSYARARRGERVELAARPVCARRVEFVCIEVGPSPAPPSRRWPEPASAERGPPEPASAERGPPEPASAERGPPEPASATAGSLWRLHFALSVSSGYYVRSFARDIGAALGVPSHLQALRRTCSGAFAVTEALDPDSDRALLRAALIPVEIAASAVLGSARLTAAGARKARIGQQLDLADFSGDAGADGAVRAWLDGDGGLVALGAVRGAKAVVVRGFRAQGGQ